MKRLAIVLALVATGACKQGLGERCQVNADCANGLVCNQAKNSTCQSQSGVGGIDATVPDGPVRRDAAPDAMRDATTPG